MDNKSRSTKYTSCFAGGDGADVLLDILTECGAFSELRQRDPIELAAANAERNVAIRIAARAGVNVSQYVDLMKQATLEEVGNDRY
ncbi:MAG: hypothetical protein GY942_18630 [Aestuariibacter sp.]|nr:hypothetical protein [Aestuariibacter sp.]